jgi:hypothetical protein
MRRGTLLPRHSEESIASSSGNCRLKLPPIKLPSFNGEYEHWITFRDMFKAIVHCNEQLSDIQKYHCRKSALTGEAERLISNIPMTTSNYPIVWKLLVDRYENERLIAARHIKQLLELKQVHKESARELAELVNSLSNKVNALVAPEIEGSLSGVIISQIVTQKLDSATRKVWENKLNDTPFPPLKDFISFLEKRRQALENVEPFKTIRTEKSSKYTLVSTVEVSCPKCKGSHMLHKCDKFLNSSLQEKRALVTRHKLCFNSMQGNHRAQTCSSKDRHKQCKKAHHTLLHQDHREKSRDKEPSILRHEETQQSVSEAESINTAAEKTGLASYCSFKRNSTKLFQRILLATAVIKVYDARGQASPCRVLLDGGSQSSYVMESLVQRLGLKCEHDEMPISGSNSRSSTATHSSDVKLSSKDGRYKNVTCFILPNLTGKMPASYVDISRLRIPKDVELADKEFNIPGSIDMLIGSDLYPYLIKDGCYTFGENHPGIQET